MAHVAGWASNSPTPAQLKEFFAQVESGRITGESLQTFLQGGVAGGLPPSLSDWQTFYAEVFGIQTDFSTLRVPEKQEGFNRLIVVAGGMTPENIFQKCQKLFLCAKGTGQSFDEIIRSQRSSKEGAYAIWVREIVEADKDLKSLSANDLEAQGIPGITLEERFLYELKYFNETGEHLDRDSVTLCSGSRWTPASVPSVGWSAYQLAVDRYGVDSGGARLRARRVVCLPPPGPPPGS